MSARHTPARWLPLSAIALAAWISASPALAAGTLIGWASLPANTPAEGPTTGQFAAAGFGANGILLPIAHGQAVQGFSGVLPGPTAQSFYVMPDNGFGTQANSADALLRMYALQPDFKVWSGQGITGSGTVAPVGFKHGKAETSFVRSTFIGLHDADHKIGFPIQADHANYYNTPGNPAVDAGIRAARLLTGADFDIESVRADKKGNLWFGEEFGPFLVKTDARGKVLRQEIQLPNIAPAGSISTGAWVQSPQNPYLAGATPNLGGSRGFEGMAINPQRDRLYTLLEGSVTGDAAKTLRINEFDIDTERYTQRVWKYKLEASGTNIGDMTAVNEHEFLVLERNGATATSGGTPFKKVFKIDINKLDADGNVDKVEIVDLMNIADPHDLNGDGSATFTFPYVTIEDILILDSTTILVMNDNNFPGGGGRSASPDINEFLKIKLDAPLALQQPVPLPGRGHRDHDERDEQDDDRDTDHGDRNHKR
ncbi:MAG: esterase-like activity of phytase family protein [Proteobacteria bacterium]|uniref:esterase-like activity of phytase family protein n=1 Tax=Aquabacterium sp. TaxID=1872578 RepID=UPI0035C66C63|nr:esterase-like activity of phytase family protein [Pseudomonadota bacterium]